MLATGPKQLEVIVDTLQRWFDGGDFIALAIAIAALIGTALTRWDMKQSSKRADVRITLTRYVDGETWSYELSLTNLGPATATDVNLSEIKHHSKSKQSHLDFARGDMLPLPILEAGEHFTTRVEFYPRGEDAFAARLSWKDKRGNQGWDEPRSIVPTRSPGGGSSVTQNVTVESRGMTSAEVEKQFHVMDRAKRIASSRR